MKKQFKVLSLLIVITFGTFLFLNKTVFFAANATYVEGPITQDTVWTLVDSPFVVSKNITIYPTATLTIEPGVKVKFGGLFSIFVEGSLYAVGTQNDNITFTSNKEQPEAGDWGTIKFNGTAPSTLTYCVIKYATNGTTIENSTVEIKNSEISTCSQNGATISNGTVTIQDSQVSENSQNGISIENSAVDVQDNTISENSQNGIWINSSVVDAQNNEISDNVESGIYVKGASQVTIQSNTVKANENGVYLTGNSAISANINQNTMQSNTQSGIYIDVNNYGNIAILHNTLSANSKGFYVSGRTSTQISNNSISYNTVGIYYKNASHTAHWNDIYGNDLGMNVASNTTVTVDAEYNYWGDESGPYHASLNPSGTGNPVGGDGESIDFVFFLTAPIGDINQRPVARLLSDKRLVPPNQIVTFFATTSSDDKRVDKFFFDFGDGSNSSWTTLSIFEHKYLVADTFQARLRVMDDFGVISNNAANIQITVQALLSPLEVALTLSRYNISSEGQVSIIAQAKIGASPVEKASITFFAIVGGSCTPQSGLTSSTGYFTATFTAPSITEETNVRITATASKGGYADGSDYKYVRVLPLLTVQVTSDPTAIKSEATSHVTVHVTHNANPISDVTVRISSNNGSFSAQTGYTNSNGNLVFNFTAPQTLTQINVSITATATKSGYFESQGQTNITVNPRTLSVQVTASSTTIEPEATSSMIVHVTDDTSPVEGANVTVSSNLGSFSATTGSTDSNGNFTLVFTAPEATTQVNVTITATATKSGYVSGEKQTIITVNPASGAAEGLPLTTILLILIPIIVVAIVAVLIKMKIIVISRE